MLRVRQRHGCAMAQKVREVTTSHLSSYISDVNSDAWDWVCDPFAPAVTANGLTGVASTQANPDIAAFKLELLTSLRTDIAAIFKKELQDTLGDVLSAIKLDLQAVKTQLANDKAATDATMSKLNGMVEEMEHALTECSDDITEMKTTIKSLTANVAKLENKCEDLESRSRRNNARIVGVPEGPDTCTTAAVAALLKEAFGLAKEPLLDHSHRTLQPKPKPGERLRAIVCGFHYHSDCVDILRRARELRQIKVRDLTISVFPDHTAKVARAWAAFNEVRWQLCDIDGARYGLIHPARLRITYNGVEKDFVSAEASDYVKTLISM
ncbi:uncharacterized protein AKAME5_002356800 [Lates japonicus]|uniref:Transposase element L1Md-A101/L1Md-A102/L1Md-A2 n=1 Tax=Lates japonicus TaxID=270547 RepID=A0AAD3NJF9_LATJO|nr:uncharacterized protein AKAME5_002356800 [Lates japonicus]